jgi:hypothetical protein
MEEREPVGLVGEVNKLLRMDLLFGRLFLFFSNLFMGCYSRIIVKHLSLLKLFGCKRSITASFTKRAV